MAIKKFKVEASEQAKKLAKKPVKASDGEWDKAVIGFIDTIPNLPEQGKVISKTYKGWPIVIVGLGNGKCLYHSYLQKANAASDIQFIRGLIKRGDAPEKAVENLGFKTYTRGDVEGACGGKKSVKSAAKRSVKCAETNADLQRAKQNIVDIYNIDRKKGDKMTVEEFDADEDLNKVSILYTNIGDDNEHSFQIFVDLINPKIIVELDGDVIYEYEYSSVGDLADDLEDFDWDDMYYEYLQFVPDEIVYGEDVNGACGSKKSVKSSAKKSIKSAETNADLERAKQNIVDGYNDEYDRDFTVDEYFKNIDLSQVPILYTTIGGVNEDEHDYQLYADLVDPKIIVEIDGKTIYEDKFPSIGALADDLEDFDWQNWHSYYLDFIPDEILDGDSVNSACGGKKSVKSSARKPARKTVRASTEYLESELADKTKYKLIKDAYNENNLTIVKHGNSFYFERTPSEKVANLAIKEIKRIYPELTYIGDIKASLKSSKRSRSVKAASADGYEFAFYRDGYRVLSKTENNRGKWLAQKDDEEPFEITYEQARGFEPIDPRNRALQMKLGKALKLPIRSSAVKAAKKDDMNKEAHKWYNISLTKDEYAKFRKFLKENGYKYEPSEEGQNTYVKVYLTKADADKVNKFLDSMDDVESACGGKKTKKTVKASAAAKRRAKKSVKASKYYEITDHYNDEVGRADTEDEARELAKKLVRENDVDHYDIFWVDTDPDSTDDTSYIDTVYADKPFSVEGYYGSDFRGLSDSDTFYELRDALEHAQELLSRGNFVRMECENAGGRLEITPDEYDEFVQTSDGALFEDMPEVAEWLHQVQVERMDSYQEPWLDNWQYNTDIGMSTRAVNCSRSEADDRFQVQGYIEPGFRGLMEDEYFRDFEDAKSYAHGLLMQGYDVRISDDVSEAFVEITSDEYQENFDGEFVVNEDIADFQNEVWRSMGIDASIGVKAALGNKNKTDYASNPIYELDKYVKDLAEGVAAAAGITLTYQVSDEAITFIDGDGTAVFIQPISEITPEPDDLENDIQELVSAIQYEDSDNPEYWPTDTTEDDPDYATRAVQMSVDDELEPVMGDGEKSLSAKIFEFLDEEGGYTDYDQKIEDVVEEFGLSPEMAESYVWDWSSGLNKSTEEGEDIGYGIDSYGGTIDESTVWELFRIADTEILPNTELAKLDPDVSIDEDSWDFYFGGVSNAGMMGVVKFYIHFKLTSDNIDLNEYVLPDAKLYPDFNYYKASLDFDIYTENGKVTDVVLESADIYKSDNSYDDHFSGKFGEAFNTEALENYIEKLAAPAAEEIYNAVSNL